MEPFLKTCDVIKILNGDWSVILPTVIQIVNIDAMIKIAYRGFLDLRNSITTFSKTYDVNKMLIADWLII